MEQFVLQEASLQAVFAYLGEVGGQNIVPMPNVTGTVSLQLKKVTWRDALDIVLKQFDLVAVPMDKYIRIMKADDYWRERVTNAENVNKVRELEPLETHVYRFKFASASAAVDVISKHMSTRGKVSADARTNSVVIIETAAQYKEIEPVLVLIDKETAMVKISAKIAILDVSALNEMGITWNILEATDNGTKSITNYPGPPPTTGGKFSIGLVEGHTNVSATIAAIIAKGRGRVIDNPEVTTMDHIGALVQSGVNVPYYVRDEAGNTQVTFVQTGTILNVTPHLVGDKRIKLELTPERSSLTSFGGQTAISTRKVNTTVVVDDGQSCIIGGLQTEEVTEVDNGVPFLKDLPLIGTLFTYTSTLKQTGELVIVVTPTIIRSKEGEAEIQPLQNR